MTVLYQLWLSILGSRSGFAHSVTLNEHIRIAKHRPVVVAVDSLHVFDSK